MPFHLTILFVLVGLLCADPVPPGALVWSGTTTASGSSTGEDGPVSPLASTTSTGFSIGAGETDQCCGGFATYSGATSFTVTLAGDFLFSSSADYNTTASTCSDIYCPSVPSPYISSDMFNGEFSGGVEILDSAGNEVLAEGLSGSGSIHYGSDCDYGDCFASLSLSDPDLVVVDLPTGNYTLEVNYTDSQNSIGQSYGGSYVETDLIPNPDPTPEPSELGFLIGGMTLAFLIKRRTESHLTRSRESHLKSGSPGLGFRRYFCVMAAHDPVNGVQTNAGGFADAFRGEEWFKHSSGCTGSCRYPANRRSHPDPQSN